MWLTVNKDKTELAWSGRKPSRFFEQQRWCKVSTDSHPIPVELPKGNIKRLIGREMTWRDDAVLILELPKIK